MAEEGKKSGWFGRLKEGLTRTSGTLSRGITEVFARPKVDNATLDDLEDLLIQTDIGTLFILYSSATICCSSIRFGYVGTPARAYSSLFQPITSRISCAICSGCAG